MSVQCRRGRGREECVSSEMCEMNDGNEVAALRVFFGARLCPFWDPNSLWGHSGSSHLHASIAIAHRPCSTCKLLISQRVE